MKFEERTEYFEMIARHHEDQELRTLMKIIIELLIYRHKTCSS